MKPWMEKPSILLVDKRMSIGPEEQDRKGTNQNVANKSK